MGRSSLAVLVGLTLASSLVGGCSSSYPRLSFAVEQRLLRETTLDDMPAERASPADGIVRVMRTGRAAGACSGALVGRRHVLTAQHCVVELDEHRELTLRTLTAGEVHVELGGDYLPWGRVGVREVHPCAGYRHDVEHDVAVLVLSKPVPEVVASFEIAYDTPSEAGVFELAGYGTDTTPRTIPLTGWSISSVTRHVHRGPVLTASDDALYVKIDGLPGDSGGPIVDTATGSIVAVVSRGESAKTARDGEPVVAGPRLSACRATIEQATRR